MAFFFNVRRYIKRQYLLSKTLLNIRTSDFLHFVFPIILPALIISVQQ